MLCSRPLRYIMVAVSESMQGSFLSIDGMRLSQHGGRLSARESRELFEGESEAVPAVKGQW